MPWNNWRQVFGWRPSFHSLLRTFNRTGCFFNDVIERNRPTPMMKYPLLRSAWDLPTLSAAAAVGLEIIIHDVNLDDIPGVVTRVNLPPALTKYNITITKPLHHGASSKGQSHLPMCPTSSYLHPNHHHLSEIDLGQAKTRHGSEGSSVLSFYSLSQVTSQVESFLYDERLIKSCVAVWGGRYGEGGVGKSFCLHGSLPSHLNWDENAIDIFDNDYVTCKEATYANLMIPVPDSHNWKWFTSDEIDVFDEHLIGGGTFADVFHASVVFYTEDLTDFTVRSVAVKTFHVNCGESVEECAGAVDTLKASSREPSKR